MNKKGNYKGTPQISKGTSFLRTLPFYLWKFDNCVRAHPSLPHHHSCSPPSSSKTLILKHLGQRSGRRYARPKKLTTILLVECYKHYLGCAFIINYMSFQIRSMKLWGKQISFSNQTHLNVYLTWIFLGC